MTRALLAQRRFRPFFLAQFLGAFNDNLFRNALIGVVTFQLVLSESSPLNTASWINIAAGLFIFPFFLCSAIAGQVADRFDKAKVIRWIKFAEIPIMLVAGFAVVSASLPVLMLAVVLTGMQSAFFGPVKYGILPVHLRAEELTSGNALVQAGTMAAILLGTIAGGLLVAVPEWGASAVALAATVVAILGWYFSRAIPPAPPAESDVRIDPNLIRSTWHIMQTVVGSRAVLLSVLGVSWFWFVGSVLLAQLPVFVRDVLGGGQLQATILLATFTVGIITGSLLCDRFSGRQVEIGLVPMGALGMAVFSACFAMFDVPESLSGPMSVDLMFSTRQGLFLISSLFLLATSAGLYVVPLYALIQSRVEAARVSRVIAFNNILNALFMVAAAVVAVLAIEFGFSIQQLVLFVTVIHVLVVVFIFSEVPEFALRLVVWVITHSLYRVGASGLDNIPDRGAAVLVSNHVSLIDALVITSKCRRPIRFVMYYKIYELPAIKSLFRISGAIPIASRREDPELLDRAYDEIAATLSEGGLIGVFPEGELTKTGELGDFKPGIEKILERSPVPVVPMALSGLWGTFFTRYGGHGLMSRWPRHWLAPIHLNVGGPIEPGQVTATLLAGQVESLRRRP